MSSRALWLFASTALLIAGCSSSRSTASSGTSGCKRGVAYGFRSAADLAAISPGATWWYDWSLQPDPEVASATGAEFVPMIWDEHFSVDDAVQKIPPDARFLLGFNEPNFQSQANLTAQEAAQLWPQLEQIAQRRGLKLVSPAVNFCGGACNETSPFAYLDAFFAACQGCQVDYVAAHWYACTGGALTWYLSELKAYGKPIWLTEFACGDTPSAPTAEQQQEYLRAAVPILEADPQVFRYAWFSGRTTALSNADLLGSDGQLTDLGAAYVGLPSGCAP